MNRAYLWGLLAVTLGLLILWGGLGVVALATGAPLGISVPVLLLLVLVYGWMLFAYLHYREGRRTEFVHIVRTAVESGVPLAPALDAYVHDRPSGRARELWVALLLLFVFPGYYVFWHRRHNYDQKVARVAHLLEDGSSLHEALEQTPGVASAETLLAVRVGEASGRLAACLKRSAVDRTGPAWLEMLPRFLYPLALLVLITGVVTFWSIYILPRMVRVLTDFGVPLPAMTDLVARAVPFLATLTPLLILAALAAVLLACSSTACWYCPGLGRLYRLFVRGRVLRMLAVFLEAGRPALEGMNAIAASGGLPGIGRRRVSRAALALTRGQALADALREAGLVTRSQAPLVQAAERVQNLPWALAELGDHLTRRAVRAMKRISLVFAPLSVIAVGALVGVVVFGMFLPLLAIMEKLWS